MSLQRRKMSGSGAGGGEPSGGGGIENNGFGWLTYYNTLAAQSLSSGQWLTLANNGAGALTDTSFAPAGITSMLDPATGRILLNQLQPGDQVHVRHTLNVVPYINGATVMFRHYVGQAGAQYEVPCGMPLSLSSGAGTPSGLFVVDAHIFVRDANTVLGGSLPKIQMDASGTVEHKSTYIAVTRRMA